MCTTKKHRRQEEILKYIEQADDFETTEIIQAIICRFSRVYPGWEVLFLSVHKEPEQRKRDIEGLIQMLRQTI